MADRSDPAEWAPRQPAAAAASTPEEATTRAAPQPGLLSRLSSSFSRPAAAAAPPPFDAEAQQPLLPGSQAEEQQLLEHTREKKAWPQLRLSSVSTRRLSPSLLSPPDGSGMISPMASAQLRPQPALPRPSFEARPHTQPLLSPRGSSGFASPFTRPLQASGADADAPMPEHHAAAPFHTPVLDYQADADALYAGGGDPGQPQKPRAAGGGAALQPGRHARAAITGVVNAVVALPVMLSFSAIIFR